MARRIPDAVLHLVRETFPKRQRANLTRAQLEDSARTFLQAGTAAVRAEHGTLRQAVASAVTAKRTLARARYRQADLSLPDEEAVLYQGRAATFRSAIRAQRHNWLKIPGVLGFGLGVRWRDGAETDEECITIFVRRKKSVGSLKRARGKVLPTQIRHRGTTIPLDVVEFGRLRRFTRGGASIGVVGSVRHGTLGTFALSNETGDPVGLTAMHVTGLQEDFPPGIAVRFASPRGGISLGFLRRGTLRGIDAARIDLEVPSEGQLEIAGIGRVRGWRPLNATDRGAPVRMRGAVSGLVAGRIERTSIDLPHENLRSAILVNIASQSGDSGAALVDNQNLVLALLIGEATSLDSVRLFSPIGPVLSRMRCDIPTFL